MNNLLRKVMSLPGTRLSVFAFSAMTAIMVLFLNAWAQDQKPTAIIDGTLRVQEGQTVYLDGALSKDSSGGYNIEDFTWTLESSPEGSLAILSSSGQQVTFVGDVAGMYRVKLVVSDRARESDPVYAIISVVAGSR